MGLPLKPRSACAFDQVSLGEVMLRLDPGEGRIRTARRFTAWAGGGEYNTSCGLRKVFGCRTAVVTALVDNEIGRLVEGLIVEAGVSTEFIRWREDDGIGRETRNGLNFTERGSGIRGALGVSDRARTAVSQLKPGDIDWDHLFGRLGVRWFHTGGIFAALSDTTAEVAVEAVEAARRHGTIVSCDLNFRASLWRERGGVERAREVNRAIVRSADVLIDCMAPLGLPGSAMTRERSTIAARDRERIALGVIFIDSARITSPKPGSSTRINPRIASGVMSRAARPVPPVVRMRPQPCAAKDRIVS